jgi:hypothetical protein
LKHQTPCRSFLSLFFIFYSAESSRSPLETATIEDIKRRVTPAVPLTQEHPRQIQAENSATNAASLGTLAARLDRLENRLITVVIDNAITSGRITPAQRGYWTAQLAGNFEEKSAQLANSGKALKTDRRVEDFMSMTEQRDATNSRKKQLTRLIDAKTAQGLSYDQAWEEVKEENPGLFASMQQPEP